MSNKVFFRILITALLLVLIFQNCPVQAQQNLEDYKGDGLYRLSNTHSGNKVRTLFYNYGLVADIGEVSGEWPIGTGNYYVGDVLPLVGVEFVHPVGDTLRSVVNSFGPRAGNEFGTDGRFWGFEPLPGFAATLSPDPDIPPRVAMSHDPNT